MNRPLWVAVDFDGTLCKHEFPEIGAPNWEMILLVRELMKTCKVFLWTCRNHAEERDYLQEAVDWCAELDLVFDGINENPFCGFETRKIVADVYIDDRSLNADVFPLGLGMAFVEEWNRYINGGMYGRRE